MAAFSIREYVLRMRDSDFDKCWPFDSNQGSNRRDVSRVLPPMVVREFRWWSEECRRTDPGGIGRRRRQLLPRPGSPAKAEKRSKKRKRIPEICAVEKEIRGRRHEKGQKLKRIGTIKHEQVKIGRLATSWSDLSFEKWAGGCSTMKLKRIDSSNGVQACIMSPASSSGGTLVHTNGAAVENEKSTSNIVDITSSNAEEQLHGDSKAPEHHGDMKTSFIDLNASELSAELPCDMDMSIASVSPQPQTSFTGYHGHTGHTTSVCSADEETTHFHLKSRAVDMIEFHPNSRRHLNLNLNLPEASSSSSPEFESDELCQVGCCCCGKCEGDKVQESCSKHARRHSSRKELRLMGRNINVDRHCTQDPAANIYCNVSLRTNSSISEWNDRALMGCSLSVEAGFNLNDPIWGG